MIRPVAGGNLIRRLKKFLRSWLRSLYK